MRASRIELVLVLIFTLFLGAAFSYFFLIEDAEAQTRTRTVRTGAFAGGVGGANCRFLITRKGQSSSRSTSYGVKTRKKIRPFASRRTSRRSGVTKSMLMVSPGLRGSIEVDGKFAQVKCIRTRRTMIVEVFAGVDKGRKVSSVSTSITVNPGQTINIGSVVRKLRNDGKDLSTSRGIKVTKVEGESKEEVFLKVQ